MAIIENGNFVFKNPTNIDNGSIINCGNFTQLKPHTVIMSGVQLTINGGNFINVAQDDQWTINGGNWVQIERCANLYPEFDLDPEDINCVHVVNIDTINVDGQNIETVYTYKDTVL